jgi:hypothetical protein
MKYLAQGKLHIWGNIQARVEMINILVPSNFYPVNVELFEPNTPNITLQRKNSAQYKFKKHINKTISKSSNKTITVNVPMFKVTYFKFTCLIKVFNHTSPHCT